MQRFLKRIRPVQVEPLIGERFYYLLVAGITLFVVGISPWSNCFLIQAAEDEESETATGPTDGIITPIDNPPKLSEIIAGLRATENKIENLTAEYSQETREYGMNHGEMPPENAVIQDEPVSAVGQIEATFVVVNDGRFLNHVSKMSLSQGFYGTRLLRTERVQYAFDGDKYRAVGFWRDPILRETQINYERGHDRKMIGSLDPFEFTMRFTEVPWNDLRTDVPLSDFLEMTGGTIVGEGRWEEQPCLVIETPAIGKTSGYKHKFRFWIDPKRGFLICRGERLERHVDEPNWTARFQIDGMKHQQFSSGIWLPMSVVKRYFTDPHVRPLRVYLKESVSVSEWSVNQKIDETIFKLTSDTSDNR